MRSGSVTYKPSTFAIRTGQHRYVDATAKRTASGLVVVDGFANGYRTCDVIVDVGYPGHLKAPTVQLPYKQARSLTIQIVDNDGKPLKAGVSLGMEVQTEDATIGGPKDATPVEDKETPFTIPIPPSSTSSRPFLLTSTNWKGGPVRVLARLRTPSGSVIAENEFLIDADPALWLPIALAIGGALLYGVYHLISDPDSTTNSKSKLFWKLFSSTLAGVIAYLFADFDLLGMKLDPHVLRTYAILGFVFSFVGIDLILSKRFRSGGGG